MLVYQRVQALFEGSDGYKPIKNGSSGLAFRLQSLDFCSLRCLLPRCFRIWGPSNNHLVVSEHWVPPEWQLFIKENGTPICFGAFWGDQSTDKAVRMPKSTNDAVDGRNPAPVDRWFQRVSTILGGAGFLPSPYELNSTSNSSKRG